MRLVLKLHPQSRSTAVQEIAVEVSRPQDRVLALRYVLTGAVDKIRWPPAQKPARGDKLWEHTCFEAFARGAGEGYVEYNFAPSTRWAAYRFASYRKGMEEIELPQPPIETDARAEAFELRTLVALPHDATRLGLACVIEEKNGAKSYWALAHPPGNPDFHHLAGFAAELPPVTPA
jgi:hypothetical protein